ncbi:MULTISPECIES: hypothetical protein [unclassified Bartonella]|uniref:hypothetical protein n=1 Tax=unclassified Bartonella TaxID=2645622 RepID=UPI00300E0B56
MNIRYFFIAGAMTSGLFLALKSSDHIVTQHYPSVTNHSTIHEFVKPSPDTKIITPSNTPEIDLDLLDKTKGTFDNLNKAQYHNISLLTSELYEEGKRLLFAVIDFFITVLVTYLKSLF